MLLDMKKLCFVLLLLMPCLTRAQSSLHISKQQFKDEFLDAINAKRATGCNCGGSRMKPATPLKWNDQLAKAATEHAKDMYRHNYFSHESPDRRSLQDRIFKVGYTYQGYQRYAIGENIAYNQRSIEQVLAGWFSSKEHCKNLMNPAFTEIGIAENKYYWVQDFGGRVSFASR